MWNPDIMFPLLSPCLVQDKARTDAYLHAIIRHEEFIRDKVIKQTSELDF